MKGKEKFWMVAFFDPAEAGFDRVDLTMVEDSVTIAAVLWPLKCRQRRIFAPAGPKYEQRSD